MRGLNERTVLVTGGANGIGAATARRLAEEGCTVGILDMDVAAAEDVADEITARGRRASFHAADISDYDAVSRAVERFEAASGPVSFLVNNAGWDRAQNSSTPRPISGARLSPSICSARST
jgi:NAD(P)-dependent dehydrogenase (short-subunit alcohol dehydrogenase family)